MAGARRSATANPPGRGVSYDGRLQRDGLFLLLLIIATFREVLGMGTFAGWRAVLSGPAWDKWIIMVMPPGASSCWPS
jgi:Na+-transporting NADH:ubiquinone oxidoreductase subunit NqrD